MIKHKYELKTWNNMLRMCAPCSTLCEEQITVNAAIIKLNI